MISRLRLVVALSSILLPGAVFAQDVGTTEIRSRVWYRSVAGPQVCNAPLPIGANDTINGSYTFYLPPDVPDPVGIAGISIDNETNWPADVVQPAGPWFAALDPGGKYVQCSKWPRQICPPISQGDGANVAEGLKLLGILDVGPPNAATHKRTHHNPPMYYHKGDAIVIATPCYTSAEIASGVVNPAKTVNPAINFQLIFPKYTKTTACDTNTKLLLHGRLFDDPATRVKLTNFVSDSSPQWNTVASRPYGGSVSGVTIDTTTPAALGQSSSIRFDGTSNGHVWVNTSNDWRMGSGDWTLEMWWRPDDMTAGKFQQLAVVDGYGPFSLGQIGNKLSFGYSTTGTSWNGGAVQWGNVALNAWTHIAVQREGGNIRLSQDGVQAQSIAVGTASLFNKDTPLRFGNSSDNLYPAKGNMQEVRISHVARFPGGNYAVPTAPYACP